MSLAHINIGTNLGHRTENILRAVCLVSERIGEVTGKSQPVESDAWGYSSAGRYLNLGINVATTLSAPEIIGNLKQIEQIIDPKGRHRTPDGGYADRVIDLDLISLGGEVWELPEATVPHPRMHLREFVLLPMAEILPQWRHPLLGLTPGEILADLRQ